MEVRIMAFYKLENNNLIIAPINHQLDDGTTILNFNLVADQYGYKNLIQNPQPSYDERYQALQTIYTETDTNIIEDWQVVEIMSLDQFKQSRIDELNRLCNQAIRKGFTSLGHFFRFNLTEDEPDQTNFTQQLADILLNPSMTTIQWKTEDVGVLTFTVDEFKQIIADGKIHKLSNMQKYWEIKAQILDENTDTFEKVLAITW